MQSNTNTIILYQNIYVESMLVKYFIPEWWTPATAMIPRNNLIPDTDDEKSEFGQSGKNIVRR